MKEKEIEIEIGGRILEIPAFAAVDVDVAVVVGFVLLTELVLQRMYLCELINWTDIIF